MVFGPVLVDSHDFEGEGRSSARPPDRPVSQFALFNSCLLQKSFVFIPPPVVQRIGETKVGVGPTTGWFNLRLLQVEMCPS